MASPGAELLALPSPMRLAVQPEPTLRVALRVTFLRMDAPPTPGCAALPPETRMERVAAPTVPFYRYLYNTVGAAHLWWLRRIAPDAELAALLANPLISIHVLYRDGAPAGFYELDRRAASDINLSYFGLLPHAVGQGLGTAFLRHAIDSAWAATPRALTVNTCTADSPRALPGYRRAGFRPLRELQEHWNIPTRLGLTIPDHLKG